jgi:predicted TIM-barrel fold metal-dependent hydrolase
MKRSRREFIRDVTLASAALTAGCHSPGAGGHEIIDCHTHFYDPTRPQGVPWPNRNETQLYRRVLPRDYMALAKPLGITGTVVVEASEWIEDNQWVLDLAKDEPFIKGLVGHLNPGDPDFASQVKRFARNPLFRGIRVSFGDVPKLNDPAKLRDLRVLAERDLSLDVNGGTDSLSTVAEIARAIPSLRIIQNHVANVRIDGSEPPREWREGMQRVAAQPNTFCKVSGLVEGSGKRNNAPRDVNFYRPVLDHVWRCFGEDRVIYGSNWPVSELFADLPTVHGIVKTYFAEHGERASRKLFAGNARRAYKWLPR